MGKIRNSFLVALIPTVVLVLVLCVLDAVIKHQHAASAEKTAATHQETVRKMHQQVMERLLSAPTGSEVYAGMVYVRSGNAVDQRPFRYQTANDADLIIQNVINGQDILGKTCHVEPIYSVGNDGVLSLAISCRPKQ